MKNLVITIGRQYGSGGRELGKKIADFLKIKYYDNELVEMAAKNNNIDPEISKDADEKASNSLLYSLSTGSSFHGMLGGIYEMPLNDRLFIAQSETIKQLAHESSCVIVGRCSNYVLHNDEEINTLNLYIYADIEDRIRRIQTEYGISEAQAKTKISKMDKKRRAYYNYYSNGNWGMASEYDICVNLSKLDEDSILDLVKNYAEKLMK